MFSAFHKVYINVFFTSLSPCWLITDSSENMTMFSRHRIYSRHSAQTGWAEKRLLFFCGTLCIHRCARDLTHAAFSVKCVWDRGGKKSSFESERWKKYYYVVLRENQSICLPKFFLYYIYCFVFCLWLRTGLEENVKPLFHDELWPTLKLKDLHQQKPVKMCLFKHTDTHNRLWVQEIYGLTMFRVTRHIMTGETSPVFSHTL